MYTLPEVNLFPTRRKTTLDLPQTTLARMAVRLNLLGALAWDYADSVICMAAQMNLRPTIKVSRAIRELKTDYDRFRSQDIDSATVNAEWTLAQKFEEFCADHILRLSTALGNEREIYPLLDDYRLLVIGVQMAMTVLDAMKLYAADCDAWIRQHGVSGRSILVPQFSRLAVLLPQYAADAYNPASPARQLTAKILYNELKQIELYGDSDTD